MSVIEAVKQYIFHSSLRRNWRIAKRYKPDTVIVLGDMLASGRTQMTDRESVMLETVVNFCQNYFPRYQKYFERFSQLLDSSPATSFYYVPGNGDLPWVPPLRVWAEYLEGGFGRLGQSRKFSPHARRRYEQYFGPVNQRISIANHTLLLLDAPGVVQEDYKRQHLNLDYGHFSPTADGALDFIKKNANITDGEND